MNDQCKKPIYKIIPHISYLVHGSATKHKTNFIRLTPRCLPCPDNHIKHQQHSWIGYWNHLDATDYACTNTHINFICKLENAACWRGVLVQKVSGANIRRCKPSFRVLQSAVISISTETYVIKLPTQEERTEWQEDSIAVEIAWW